MIDWHRLFGLFLMDFFSGSPFVVELEKDLSVKKQLLDVVILRRGKGRFVERLPDGLEGLAAQNLLTFKSFREALDDWALKELTGHYVAYRKLLSPSGAPLLPEDHFRLYAVCCRSPENLAARVSLDAVSPGVYDCHRGTDTIRVIVTGELPEAEHNAPLHLFSAMRERVAYGASHYRKRSEQTSTLLDRLFEGYQREGVAMPYTMEDFKRDYIAEGLAELSPEERQEALCRLSPEERLAGLSLEEIEDYLRRQREATAPPPQPKKPGGKARRRPKR